MVYNIVNLKIIGNYSFVSVHACAYVCVYMFVYRYMNV